MHCINNKKRKSNLINAIICSFPFLPLLVQVWQQWQQENQGSPGVPLLSYVLQLFLGDTQVFPRPGRIYTPSSGFLVCPKVSSQSDMSKIVPQRAIHRHSEQILESPQLSLLNTKKEWFQWYSVDLPKPWQLYLQDLKILEGIHSGHQLAPSSELPYQAEHHDLRCVANPYIGLTIYPQLKTSPVCTAGNGLIKPTELRHIHFQFSTYFFGCTQKWCPLKSGDIHKKKAHITTVFIQ